MPLKVPGAGNAVGYWGRNIRCRINQDQTMQKISANQMDQLLGGGLRARLWQNVHPLSFDDVVQLGTMPCSCVKKSGEHADRRCKSCYGIGFVPGYTLFGYGTVYAASISPGLVSLGTSLNTTLKPNRWELAGDSLFGTVETPPINFVRPPGVGGAWEVDSAGAVRHPDSSLDVEVSVNGDPYLPLGALPVVNPSNGTLRFRITMARGNASVPSPFWEILRARFPVVGISEDGRLGPWILLLKTVGSQKVVQDPRGNLVEGSNNRFWTKPLSFFNCRIKPQLSLDAPIPQNLLIRDQAFIEYLDGVHDGPTPTRWSLTDYTYDDPLSYFTRQFFTCRQDQEKEYISLVFLAL